MIDQVCEGYGPPVPPLNDGEPGTGHLPPSLEPLLEKLVRDGRLSPNYWGENTCELRKPMEGDEDPIVKLYPANSGSLNFTAAKTQKREFMKYKAGCGTTKVNFNAMQKKWNEKKIYALLKNGQIAVAPDTVVSESVGLDADMSADTYTRIAKEMCLRMEDNVKRGKSCKTWKEWFQPGYKRGGGSGVGGKRSGRSVDEGNGSKKSPRIL